ncbi:LysR family transcriptional regulator [Neisseria sp. ZJ106]|uniref:LysR family transcriptional regulator n=1 Tax=Neisseria lisongii TaxID=2912188 RepID=A0ABY7RHR3_9NEIS|nr:LysR family transcriptional regulator [Neisseria lisongii]MCF7520799.1 LysR family transcriptional regulator [Neisseria lisongii]WCL70736.1 LysR family transcriptional regulator [Neisseria lisongii]
MDTNQLKSFVAVAHQGNLTQASERLCLSQPAVSAQIKALEGELGVALFTRTSSGMVLTRAGETLLPEVEVFLRHKHKLEHFAKTLAENYAEEIKLGLIHPVDSDKLAAVTAMIDRTAPKTQLHIQYGMSGEILSRIQHKTLHGGFFLGYPEQRGIHALFLQDIAYSLICPQQEYDTIQQNLPLTLENYIWIEMSGVSGSNKHLQKFWRANRLSPKRQIWCDYPQTIIDLVANGIGVAMVPSNKAETAIGEGRPIAVIEKYRQTMPLHFIYAHECEDHPGLQLLKQCVETIWQIG